MSVLTDGSLNVVFGYILQTPMQFLLRFPAKADTVSQPVNDETSEALLHGFADPNAGMISLAARYRNVFPLPKGRYP